MRHIKYIGYALSFAYITYRVLIPIAYTERHYHAIGGEWLAIFIVLFGTLWALYTDDIASENRNV